MNIQFVLSRIIKTFKKYKNIMLEIIKNIFSFSLLIIVQQIIALPIISRVYDADLFGKVVLAFGISNIIATMFGFSVGNARLLDQKFYNFKYIKLLIINNILILIIGFTVYNLIFDVNIANGIIFTLICMFGSVRLFFTSEYRIRNDHNWILKQNIYYFLGLVIGITVFIYLQNWLMIFLAAEVISVLLSYISFFHRIRFFKMFIDRSDLKSTNTTQLMLNNGFSYSLSQYDRLIIYPLLGSANVSIYYSISISARISSLIMNPLSNYFLGKLAHLKEEINKRIINLIIKISLAIIIIYFFITLITTPLLVRILYPSFLASVEHLLIPICIGAAFMGGANVLKVITMKHFGVKMYNKVFLIYAVILIILSIILSLSHGLLGVAVAKAISSATLFVFLLFLLKVSYRKMKV